MKKEDDTTKKRNDIEEISTSITRIIMTLITPMIKQYNNHKY